MRRNVDEIVSASEIASWAWCPESWRLHSLGAEPGNRAALEKGETQHAGRLVFEERSRSAISLGWWLFGLALVLALLAIAIGRV